MICNAKPYEGDDAYIFVSYSRKDAGIVYPLIERLAQEGVRIWYDSGIHGGETWPEVIADHLKRCDAFLAFMSQNAVSSHNCYNELIFAVESKKTLIPVRFNDAQLTLGLRMMIGSAQWVDIKGKPTEKDVSYILSLKAIRSSHGFVNRSIAVHDYQLGEEESPPMAEWNPTSYAAEDGEKKKPVPSFELEVDERNKATGPMIKSWSKDSNREDEVQENYTPIHIPIIEERKVPNTSIITEQRDAMNPNGNHFPQPGRIYIDPAEERNKGAEEIGAEDAGEKTIAENLDDEYEKTVAASREILPTFVVLSGVGIKHRGKNGITVLGRSKNKADIVIPDMDRKVSGIHCRIIETGSSHIVEDMHSTNGTWIDGEELPAEKKHSVENVCELRLYSVRVLAAFEQQAESLWRAERLLALCCQETMESKYLWEGSLLLGRSYPWKNNIMKDGRISHTHASIRIVDDAFILKDENSTNGTLLNGSRIEPGAEEKLSHGDIIRIGSNQFVVSLYYPKGVNRE